MNIFGNKFTGPVGGARSCLLGRARAPAPRPRPLARLVRTRAHIRAHDTQDNITANRRIRTAGHAETSSRATSRASMHAADISTLRGPIGCICARAHALNSEPSIATATCTPLRCRRKSSRSGMESRDAAQVWRAGQGGRSRGGHLASGGRPATPPTHRPCTILRLEPAPATRVYQLSLQICGCGQAAGSNRIVGSLQKCPQGLLSQPV